MKHLGCFRVSFDGHVLDVEGTIWHGWEHVSVSLPDRCPTWDEMNYVKRLFFEDEQTAMQLHPPQSRYKNELPFTLHIWRPYDQEIPLPPAIGV